MPLPVTVYSPLSTMLYTVQVKVKDFAPVFVMLPPGLVAMKILSALIMANVVPEGCLQPSLKATVPLLAVGTLLKTKVLVDAVVVWMEISTPKLPIPDAGEPIHKPVNVFPAKVNSPVNSSGVGSFSSSLPHWVNTNNDKTRKNILALFMRVFL